MGATTPDRRPPGKPEITPAEQSPSVVLWTLDGWASPPHLCPLVCPLLDGGPDDAGRPPFGAEPGEPEPDDVRKQIIDMALENSELSPRELATKFTVSAVLVCEATVYRLLKGRI
jgi:hypothetical protein